MQKRRILVIASGGGHWEQMMLLRDAFEEYSITFATTLPGLGERAGIPDVRVIPDCNRHRPMQAMWCLLRLSAMMFRLRPHAVASTGALPGVIALALGRGLGARTIWIDSAANAEKMSMAGLQARRHADLWLTQWPAVAEATGATYAGAVL